MTKKIKWPTTVLPAFPLGTLDWQEQSECQWHDPDLWNAFTSGAQWARVAKAQEICAGCPVRTQCLEYGIREHESGVYGGLYLSKGHALQPGTPAPVEKLRAERAAA